MVDAYQRATGIKIKYEFAPRRPGDIPENYANCDKAKQELGFVCKYTIQDACRDSYNFQKKQKEGK